MKMLKKISIFFIMVVLCISVIQFPVFAASISKDGLEITLTTDKEKYEKGEKIKSTLTVTNTNDIAVSNVSLENLIPDGYILSEDSTAIKKIETLDAGETVFLTVTYVTEDPEDNGENSNSEITTDGTNKPENENNDKNDAQNTGDDNNITILVVLTAVSFVIIVIFTLKKKKGKCLLSLLLCFAMVGTVLSNSGLAVKAAEIEDERECQITERVIIDGSEININAVIKYIFSSTESETLYTVTFDTNGGNAIEQQMIVNGETAAKPQDPIKTGFLFIGWYTDNNFKYKFDFNTKIVQNLTLYAKWIETSDESELNGSFNILFDLNYTGCPTRATQIVEKSKFVLEPDSPARKGYTFDGWYTSIGNRYDFNTPVFKSMVLYAKWNIIDTDGDGASDAWETANGFDPNFYNSKFYVTNSIEDSGITTSVSLSLKGSQAESLMISKTENTALFNENMPGYIGPAFDFKVDGIFDNATISFAFDPALLSNDANPVIYYFNEETNTLEEMDTTVESGIAYTDVTHFSTYVLLNKTDFDQIWNNDIKPPENEDNPNLNGLDVVFVIDSSGSMSSNDSQNLRLEAARAFVEKLTEDDRAAVIDFDSSAYLLQKFTNDHEVLNEAISRIDNSGGTDLSEGIKLAIDQFTDDSYVQSDTYKYIIFLTDGNGYYNNSLTDKAIENNIVIYTVGLGNGVDDSLLNNIANNTGGKYFFASSSDALAGIYEDISGETIDYITDSNGDGISDYFTQKLCDGILTLGSGIPTPLAGISYDNIQANDDYDGDSVKNGDELEIIHDIITDRIYVVMHSNPTVKDVHKPETPNIDSNTGGFQGSEIFDEVTNLWGIMDSTYRYNGTELKKNCWYSSPGKTKIDIDMRIPPKAILVINGDLEVKGNLILESGASLICTGNLNVKNHLTLEANSSLKCENGKLKIISSGILDIISDAEVVCKDFYFDSNINHSGYLTNGIITVSGDVEIRENFYASGYNEFCVVGSNVHTINMWAKIIDEQQYFNIFHVIGNGIEVLEVKEPFRCLDSNGFVMDDWSWLKFDYYGEDFLFTGTKPVTNDLHNTLQTGIMLAIAKEGKKEDAILGGFEYISVDEKSFSYQVYDTKAKKLKTYILQNVKVVGEKVGVGSAIFGQFYYNGQLYIVSMNPELTVKIWNDFKNTATIGAIKEIGDIYLGAYKNLIKVSISEFLPDDIYDSLKMTEMIKKYSDIFRKYYELEK